MHHEYIPINIQQDAALHNLFISGNCSTCFMWYLHPSSGAHITVSTASVWQIPDAVDTVVYAPDDGSRYHPKHVEQFPYINKLCNVASCWIFIGTDNMLLLHLCRVFKAVYLKHTVCRRWCCSCSVVRVYDTFSVISHGKWFVLLH